VVSWQRVRDLESTSAPPVIIVIGDAKVGHSGRRERPKQHIRCSKAPLDRDPPVECNASLARKETISSSDLKYIDQERDVSRLITLA
jgi:hypothetical protein